LRDITTTYATPDAVVWPNTPTKAEAATETTNHQTLRTRMENALPDLKAYANANSLSSTQIQAAIKLLCRVAGALVRLQLSKLDTAD
jgi:phosphoketolase